MTINWHRGSTGRSFVASVADPSGWWWYNLQICTKNSEGQSNPMDNKTRGRIKSDRQSNPTANQTQKFVSGEEQLIIDLDVRETTT